MKVKVFSICLLVGNFSQHSSLKKVVRSIWHPCDVREIESAIVTSVATLCLRNDQGSYLAMDKCAP